MSMHAAGDTGRLVQPVVLEGVPEGAAAAGGARGLRGEGLHEHVSLRRDPQGLPRVFLPACLPSPDCSPVTL